MTRREALDKLNGEPSSTDALRDLLDSGPIRVAIMAFFIGLAWSDLHAAIRENKMESEMRFTLMGSDIHALKVLACRGYSHDSVCVP